MLSFPYLKEEAKDLMEMPQEEVFSALEEILKQFDDYPIMEEFCTDGILDKKYSISCLKHHYLSLLRKEVENCASKTLDYCIYKAIVQEQEYIILWN